VEFIFKVYDVHEFHPIRDGVRKKVFIVALLYYSLNRLKLYDVLIILHKLRNVINVVREGEIISSLLNSSSLML